MNGPVEPRLNCKLSPPEIMSPHDEKEITTPLTFNCQYPWKRVQGTLGYLISPHPGSALKLSRKQKKKYAVKEEKISQKSEKKLSPKEKKKRRKLKPVTGLAG